MDAVAEVVGVRGAANPHLWYDPDVVPRTAAGASPPRCATLSPDAADVLPERSARPGRPDLQPYTDEIAALRPTAAGRTYAATETVFDWMAARRRA